MLQAHCANLEVESARALHLVLNVRAQHTVPAWSLFGLLAKRTIVFTTCGPLSVHYEMQNHLQVSIPKGLDVTLKRAELREFSLETLVGNDGKCNECRGLECRHRETDVERWPPLLVVQVRRFALGPGGRRWVKNDKPMQFGLEEEFLGQTYSLRSFVVHHGMSRSHGHCTAYCRAGVDTFYHCDDGAAPVLKPWSVVRRQLVYLLFYQAADRQGGGDAYVCEACGWFLLQGDYWNRDCAECR